MIALRPGIKRFFLYFSLAAAILACSAFILTSWAQGKRRSSPAVSRHSSLLPGAALPSSVEGPRLKVLTLNVAHGRKDRLNQFLQSGARIRSNLDDIAYLLKTQNADIVAIQEADAPSIWSGNFDHVAYIAEKAGYAYSVHGAHVDGAGISFGTALLSKKPLHEPLSVTFAPSPPTFSKGFVAVSFFPDDAPVPMTAVSVHFDFSRRKVRDGQVQDMVDALSAGGRPLVVMGDFNSDWKEGSAVHVLAQRLKLEAYRADARDMVTYPTLKTRLDWILISEDLEFADQKILPDVVSDHFAVVSHIRKKTPAKI